MPSFTTIFRATVMLAVGAIVFKGWQLYGPPAEQVKSVAGRAVDMAQAAWKNFQPPAKAADPPASAPPSAQTIQPPAREDAIAPPALSPQTLTPSPPASTISSASDPATPAPTAPLAETTPAANDDRVKTLLSRLEQLGGADPKLAPWGSGGRLFRCCCQAPLASSPAVMQHFESVAEDPAIAVEQVVAKVEASRTAQRNRAVLPY